MTLRINQDVLDWFGKQGKGYQSVVETKPVRWECPRRRCLATENPDGTLTIGAQFIPLVALTPMPIGTGAGAAAANGARRRGQRALTVLGDALEVLHGLPSGCAVGCVDSAVRQARAAAGHWSSRRRTSTRAAWARSCRDVW